MGSPMCVTPLTALSQLTAVGIGEADWEFKTSFSASPEQLHEPNADLVFDGLDTYCDITLVRVWEMATADDTERKTHSLDGEYVYALSSSSEGVVEGDERAGFDVQKRVVGGQEGGEGERRADGAL